MHTVRILGFIFLVWGTGDTLLASGRHSRASRTNEDRMPRWALIEKTEKHNTVRLANEAFITKNKGAASKAPFLFQFDEAGFPFERKMMLPALKQLNDKINAHLFERGVQNSGAQSDILPWPTLHRAIRVLFQKEAEGERFDFSQDVFLPIVKLWMRSDIVGGVGWPLRNLMNQLVYALGKADRLSVEDDVLNAAFKVKDVEGLYFFRDPMGFHFVDARDDPLWMQRLTLDLGPKKEPRMQEVMLLFSVGKLITAPGEFLVFGADPNQLSLNYFTYPGADCGNHARWTFMYCDNDCCRHSKIISLTSGVKEEITPFEAMLIQARLEISELSGVFIPNTLDKTAKELDIVNGVVCSLVRKKHFTASFRQELKTYLKNAKKEKQAAPVKRAQSQGPTETFETYLSRYTETLAAQHNLDAKRRAKEKEQAQREAEQSYAARIAAEQRAVCENVRNGTANNPRKSKRR